MNEPSETLPTPDAPVVITTRGFDAMFGALSYILMQPKPVTDLGWATIGEKAVEVAAQALKIVAEDQKVEG